MCKFRLFLMMTLLTPCLFGGETPEPWRVEADRRIEAHRKGNLTLKLTRDGQPVSAGMVEVRQVRHGFLFGTCVNQWWLRREGPLGEKYRDFIANHFSAMVAESAMKWPQTEPERGKPFYDHADLMVAFAKEHGLALRGHCLFWTKIKFKADWMREMEGEPLRVAMREHVQRIVSRYENDVIAWDVNNEMLNARFFEERVGEGIRPQVFKWAHAAAPEVPLFVNEYSILNEPDRVEKYLGLIEDLKAEGASIGGIGIQEHAAERVLQVASDTNTPERQSAVPLTPEGVWATLDRLHEETGLPIHITEISFRSEDPAVRGEALDKFFRVAFAHEAVDVLMLWGFWSRSHWLKDQAALVDRDFNLLPGGEALLRLLEEEWKTKAQGDLTPDGFSFRGFYGGYEGVWTGPDGTSVPFRFELERGVETAEIKLQ